jgi:hypothetical protein
MADLQKELMDSFKSLYDLAVRIDERVKNLIIRSDSYDDKFSEVLNTQKDVEGRMRVLESKAESINDLTDQFKITSTRIQSLEISNTGKDDRWKVIVNFCVQLSLILVAAYLLYKLGLQAPAVP